jgi:hypothetical protein
MEKASAEPDEIGQENLSKYIFIVEGIVERYPPGLSLFI